MQPDSNATPLELGDAQTILDSISDAFFSVNENWEFSYVNRQTERTLGVQAGDLLGHSIWTVFPGAVGTDFETMYRKAARERIDVTFNAYYPDHHRWYEVHVYPLQDGLSVYFRDVSERMLGQTRRDALIALSDSIRDLKTPQEIMHKAAQVLGEALAVSRVGYGTIDSSAETLDVVREWNAPGLGTLDGSLKLRDCGSFIDDLMAGNFVCINDVDEDDRTSHAASALKRRGTASFVNVPVIERSRLVALLYVNHAEVRNWTADELALIKEVAERVRTASEQLQNELALRESEAKFRTIANAMPQMVWSTLPDGFHDYYNEQWYEFTGMPQGSTDGDGWNAIFHPEDQQRAGDVWRHALFTGEIYTIEYRLRHHSGSHRWVLGRALPITDSAGKIIRWMGTCTDIHDQKIASDQLKEFDRRLIFQLELADLLRPLSSPEQVIYVASEMLGRYLKVSRVLFAEVAEDQQTFSIRCDWTCPGLKSVAGISRPMNDFGPEIVSLFLAGVDVSIVDACLDSRTAAYADAYAQIDVRANLSIPLIKSGRLRVVLCLHKSTPHHWTAQEIQMARDMAERTWLAVETAHVQAELQQSEARKTMLLKLSDRLRSVADDPDAMMAVATEELARMLDVPRVGYVTLDERQEYGVVAHHYSDPGQVPHAPARQRFEDYGPHLVDEIRAGVVTTISDLAIDPRTAGAAAGTHAAIGARAFIAAPIQRHQKTVAFLFAHNDQPRQWTDHDSELIRQTADRTWEAMERARAATALRQADRGKDEFLAMLAHELRNPLAPISSAAEVLRLTHPDPGRVKKTSEIIARQVNHLTALVDDLLDVSRVTRGLIKLEKAELDAKSVVYGAIEQIRPLIEARRHHLSVQIPPETTLVDGDAKRLIQVVVNLLSNAAKYTPEGGNIAITLVTDEHQVAIRVADNGIGMAPDVVSHAFDLFVQAERASDRTQGGLGIGLAVVKGLVDLHAGKISAYSAGLGLGSEFALSLPRLKADGTDVCRNLAEESTLIAAAKPLKILLVDDNVDAAHMLGMLVEALGYQVMIEHGSKRALDRALLDAPDVYLLDIGLPDMDGNELARRLRSRPENAQAVLIAITGYGQESDRSSAFAAGFDHHLVKPVNATKLASILGKI